MTQKIKHGEVWLANLNPGKGVEPGKTRPVLVVQAQPLLDVQHPSTLIIPLTTQLIDDAYPLRVRVQAKNKLEKDSDLLIDQVRAIDNKRLIKGPLTLAQKSLLKTIYTAIQEVMGFDVSVSE